MTPIDPAVIRRKLTVITANLRALEPVVAMELSRYRGDIFTRKGTERLLQELIEAALDLNMHLLAQAGRKLPDDYYQSFLLMGEQGILSKELTAALAPSAGTVNLTRGRALRTTSRTRRR